MALKPEQAQAIIREVGNRKVNHGKLTHMHGSRGKYTILAHLLDMSQYGASEDNRNPMLEAIVLNYSPQSLDLHSSEQIEQLTQLRLLEKTVEYNQS